jgi:glycogen(starch) synthase
MLFSFWRPDRGHGKDILFVGRLVYAKGVDTLLRALVILRDQRAEHPRLTIVGGGPEEAELKGLTTTLGLDGQVTFVGSRSQNEVAAIMNEHILVVVPSRPHPPEAFGIVAVEAIACGCVVLASNCGGLPEAVGSCGMLFETENPESLAACLSPILSDAALRERFTSQAPNHLAEFDRVRVVDAYERHLTAIATTAGAR